MLLSLPCISAIKKKSNFIHIACRPDTARLLRQSRCVDETSCPDSSIYTSLYTAEADAKTGEFLGGFDQAFIFTARNDPAFTLAIANSIPETKSIMTIPPEGMPEHAAPFRLRQLAPVSKPGFASLLLDIPPAYRRSAKDLLRKKGYSFDGTHLIALHPGSGGKTKCWPLEHYLALAERIVRRSNSFVLILSGHAEDRVTKKKIDGFAETHDNALHVRDGELVVVAALLSFCSLYIGNDSGISHLAGVVNGNVIALFGPTDPAVWKPLGGNVKVISAGLLSEISVEEVYETAGDFLTLM